MPEQPSNSLDLERVIDYADRIIRTATHLIQLEKGESGERKRRGGYLVVAEIPSSSIELILRLGHFDVEKMDKRIEIATEKVQRLLQGGGVTSYETRDPDNDRWGGAVKAEQFIFSFSGLPELWDEAAMFVLAIRLGYLEELPVFAAYLDSQQGKERAEKVFALLEATKSWRA